MKEEGVEQRIAKLGVLATTSVLNILNLKYDLGLTKGEIDNITNIAQSKKTDMGAKIWSALRDSYPAIAIQIHMRDLEESGTKLNKDQKELAIKIAGEKGYEAASGYLKLPPLAPIVKEREPKVAQK